MIIYALIAVPITVAFALCVFAGLIYLVRGNKKLGGIYLAVAAAIYILADVLLGLNMNRYITNIIQALISGDPIL